MAGRRGPGAGTPPLPHPQTLSRADHFRARVRLDCESLKVNSLKTPQVHRLPGKPFPAHRGWRCFNYRVLIPRPVKA